MTAPTLTGTTLGGAPNAPLLLVGPSLGTSVTALWSAAAALLAEEFQVVGWDLPGHGSSAPAPEFSIADLAQGVVDLVDRIAPGASFHYAGDSAGGAVGLQLLVDAPERLLSATLISTGALIGNPHDWLERAATVRESGTPVMVSGSAERWFAPGFLDREPEVGGRLLTSLQEADAASYAAVCHALAAHDLRDSLASIRVSVPVLAIAGAHDQPTPVANLSEIASGIAGARLEVLDDVAHLPPAEAPADVARLILASALRAVR